MAITNQLATYKIYTTMGADTGWFPIYFATAASQVAVVASDGVEYSTSRQFVTGTVLDKLNLTVNSAGAFATINETETIGGSNRNVLPELNIPHTWLYPLTVQDAIRPTRLVFPNDSVGRIETPIPGDENNYFGINFSAQDVDNLSVDFYGVDSLTWNKTPKTSNHLTNKAYVDMVAGYGVNPLTPVRVATTTSAINLSGIQTIDNVVLAEGNRILVKNQAIEADNGIYIVSSGQWTRPADADVAGELTGALVVVEEGSSKGFTFYQRKTVNTVGTDDQDWIVFNNVVSFYSADNTSLELEGSQFKIKDGGVTESKIGTGAIVDSKIAENAKISLSKLGTTTPSDSSSLLQDNQPRFISGYLNELATLLKKATGNTHWYVPVDSGRGLINKQNIPIVSATQPSSPLPGDVWIHI